jgi:DNA polymerase III alpha subunit
MAQRQVASVYDTPLAKLSEREQQIAQRLEGVVREMGIHACGIAVCGEDISQRVPVACVNHYYHTERVAVTQYTGAQLESVGVVKFNILSAKHLSIMRRAVSRLERERGIRIDVDALPYDDKATLQLYSRAETIATFQFDSDIMRQMLIDRKVATFKDLVEIYTIHCNNGIHAVAYSRLAYQTAYLKAHYPLEYMEAALYYNRYNRECVDLYREECRRLGVLEALFGDEA